MPRSAKMGELKRAAALLGVTSTALRQHGWKTASPARVQAALADPPGWLSIERERRNVQVDRDRSDAERRAATESRQAEIDAAYWRALKDGGDTDAWAAGVLHRAGIHTIESDGQSLPVLPPMLRVVPDG